MEKDGKKVHFAQFWCNVTSFRINTCKSVSKQRTLTPFRMNTYEKQGVGGPSSGEYLVSLGAVPRSISIPEEDCLTLVSYANSRWEEKLIFSTAATKRRDKKFCR